MYQACAEAMRSPQGFRASPYRPRPLCSIDEKLTTASKFKFCSEDFHILLSSWGPMTKGCKIAKRNMLGNAWVFVQLIFGPGWSTNQLYKNPNIA